MKVRFVGDAQAWLGSVKEMGVVIGAYSVLLTCAGTVLHLLMKGPKKSAWTTSVARLLGIVGVCFACALLPEVFLRYRAVDSAFAMFFLACYAVIGCFKAFEKAVGTNPPATQDSLLHWLCYFVSPIEPSFGPVEASSKKSSSNAQNGSSSSNSSASTLQVQNGSSAAAKGKFLAAAPGATAKHLRFAALFFCLNCLLFSIAAPHGFAPWEQRYLNTVIQGAMIYASLEFFTHMLAVPLTLAGVAPVQVMRNPMLASTSPRDLWGRRWNMVIHRLLARTYFAPLARRGWRFAGAALCFVVSGLFHEYIWHVILRNHQKIYGEVTVFFLVQLAICSVQSALEHALPTFVRRWNEATPALLKTAITWVLVFPSGHFFTHNMLRGKVYERMADFFPYAHVEYT